jgi:hypothetical protein
MNTHGSIGSLHADRLLLKVRTEIDPADTNKRTTNHVWYLQTPTLQPVSRAPTPNNAFPPRFDISTILKVPSFSICRQKKIEKSI